jgi:hypothetical protein
MLKCNTKGSSIGKLRLAGLGGLLPSQLAWHIQMHVRNF